MLADLRKIASQSFIYGLGTMAPKLAGFILIPVYTKHFSVSEFGILGLLDSTSQIIIGIVGLALYQGFFRWYFDKQAETRKKSLFFTLLIVHVLLAILSVILIWPFGTYLSKSLFGHPGYTSVLRLMVITSLIQMIAIMPSTLLRLQERAGLYTVGNLLQMSVMVVITVYLIVFQHMGVEAIYYAQLIGLISYLLLLLNYIVTNCEIRIEWDLLKQILKFCFPLVLSSIAIVLLNQADRYVIKYFYKLGDVGLYTLGFRLSNTLNILLVASISFAIQPMIFKKMDDPNNRRFYSKLLTYFVLVVMFFLLGMMFFGKEIVKIFAKRQEYYEAYQIIPILCFAILFNMMKDMAMIGLQITKKTHSIAGIVILVSVTGILLNIALVPWLHNFGAALAKLAASILFFILIYYYAQKAYPIQYEMKKLIMMILIGALLYIPVILINDMGVMIRILVKSLLIFSYPVLLYILGFFEPVELEKIKGAWLKWRHPSELIANLKGMRK